MQTLTLNNIELGGPLKHFLIAITLILANSSFAETTAKTTNAASTKAESSKSASVNNLSIAMVPPKEDPSTANIRDGVMLYGYDPVTYFTSANPAKGKKEIRATVDGLTYQFATEDNKKLFTADPQKYRPQYQGWCATAVAGGYKYDIDPENFKVTDGKLYLFYKGWKGDAKKDWVKNEPDSIKKADQNWPTVKTSKE